MQVSQVPKLKILPKLVWLPGFYTNEAAMLLTTVNTKTIQDSIPAPEGTLPVCDGSEIDKFGTCTELHNNVLYMCNKHN